MFIQVTILYSTLDSIKIHSKTVIALISDGRVIIDDALKEDKVIIAVLNGDVEILNVLGERVDTTRGHDDITTLSSRQTG